MGGLAVPLRQPSVVESHVSINRCLKRSVADVDLRIRSGAAPL